MASENRREFIRYAAKILHEWNGHENKNHKNFS